MASIGKTNYAALPQWQLTDKPQMNDFNDAFEKIDALLKSDNDQLQTKATKDNTLQAALYAQFASTLHNPNDGVTPANIFANPPLDKMAPISVHQLTFSPGANYQTPLCSNVSEYYVILTFAQLPTRALQIAIQVYRTTSINGRVFLRTRHMDDHDYTVWQPWKEITTKNLEV